MHIKNTQELVDEWMRAQKRLAQARSEVNSAECHLTNAANELGKHIAPSDAAIDESIAIWVRTGRKTERLLVVTREHGGGNYKLLFRGSPKEREDPNHSCCTKFDGCDESGCPARASRMKEENNRGE